MKKKMSITNQNKQLPTRNKEKKEREEKNPSRNQTDAIKTNTKKQEQGKCQ